MRPPPPSPTALSQSALPSVSSIAASIFDRLQGCQPSEAPPSDLAALHTLFGRNLPRALALAESGAVTRVTGTPSGRSVFQVRAGALHGGGHHHHRGAAAAAAAALHAHTTFPDHYCSCDSFFYEVASKGDAAACKHQLAARLASALGCATQAEVPDQVLARLLIAG